MLIVNTQVKEELTPYFPYSTKKRKILTPPSSSGASEIWLNPADIHNTAPSHWVILPNSSHQAGRLPAASFAASNLLS